MRLSRKSDHGQSSVLLHVRGLLAYLILPNAVFWIGGRLMDLLPRATFNIDYLLVGACVPFVAGWVSVAMMSLAVLADVFRSSGSIYYFSQKDALSALRFVQELSPVRVIGIATVAILSMVAWSWILLRIGSRKPPARGRTPVLVALLVLMAGIGVWGGNSSLRFRDGAVSGNMCTSSGLAMLKNAYTGLTRKADRLPPQPVDSATRRFGWLDKAPQHQNVVLIVVESWGLAQRQDWRQLLEGPFLTDEMRSRYDVTVGTVPFHGPTVPGEMRELCGVASGVIQRAIDAPDVRSRCLPEKMRQAGYSTTMLHGFSGHMFDRQDWVPKMGFQRVLFRAELKDAGLRQCGGPFDGACDADVANWIGKSLAAEPDKRHFIYWITLNSHLPVEIQKENQELLGCDTPSAPSDDPSTCNLLALLLRANRGIAETALRSNLPDTEFIIAGDHAPPFIYKSRREQFSQAEVPYVHLSPKPKVAGAH